MDFHLIKSSDDIQKFIKKTNSLHDSYIVGVHYTNDTLLNTDENGNFVDPEKTKLTLTVLVTSIYDTVVEIEFESIAEWQIRDERQDIQEAFLFFNEQNFIVWSDCADSVTADLKNGSYVIARSMKWRTLNFEGSVDDLRGNPITKDEAKQTPREVYKFQYSKEDVCTIYKKLSLPFIKQTVIFTACCFMLFLCLCAAKAPDLFFIIPLSLFLGGIVNHIRSYISYKKEWKEHETRIVNSNYIYKVFENFFVLNIFKDEERYRFLKIYFSDIKKVLNFNKYLILQDSTSLYILKKDALIADSLFMSLPKS